MAILCSRTAPEDSCPSLPVIVANPLHMSALVTVVGIPLYRLVINFACLWKHVDAHKNVDIYKPVPLTTASCPIYHITVIVQ